MKANKIRVPNKLVSILAEGTKYLLLLGIFRNAALLDEGIIQLAIKTSRSPNKIGIYSIIQVSVRNTE
jgi:hypothetical protein